MPGVAGALLAQTTQIVSLDLFDFHRSADVMLMLIIGGAGYLYGGIIGAARVHRRCATSSRRRRRNTGSSGSACMLVVLVMVGRDRLAVVRRAASVVLAQRLRGSAA